MKKTFLIILALALVTALGLFVGQKPSPHNQPANKTYKKLAPLSSDKEIKDGDIIFQTSLSQQSKAVQQATHSPFSVIVKIT